MMRVFLAVLLFVTSASQGPPGVDTGQEAAVRKVVETYLQARERRDEKALRALFTEDADQLVSSAFRCVQRRRHLTERSVGAFVEPSRQPLVDRRIANDALVLGQRALLVQPELLGIHERQPRGE